MRRGMDTVPLTGKRSLSEREAQLRRIVGPSQATDGSWEVSVRSPSGQQVRTEAPKAVQFTVDPPFGE